MINTILSILNKNYDFELKELDEETLFSSLQQLNNSFDSLTRIQFLIDLEDALEICFPANLKIDSISDIKKYMDGQK